MSNRQTFPVKDGPEKRAGATRKVRGRDLEIGDILYFLSSPHRITHFDSYTGTFAFIDRIARAGDPDNPHCWGMSIDPCAHYHIA